MPYLALADNIVKICLLKYLEPALTFQRDSRWGQSKTVTLEGIL